ncbi:hypothetical protein VKT23_018962 [Stygiomarasmius scandens]|uniref:Dehydrin n=1 Tax=Marasmiellus scandens TaxID=2682957 RepID=A0ABR1IR02_9AGAR
MSSTQVHPSAIGSATQPETTKPDTTRVESDYSINGFTKTSGSGVDTNTDTAETTKPDTTRVESDYSINGFTKTSGSGVDTNTDTGNDAGADSGEPYPEQRHAGKVGYGPNYNQGAGLGEKLTGFKEELKGKVSHDPTLVQQGKERRTGELKHKQEQEELEASDPFANPEEKKEEQGDVSQTKKDIRGQVDQAATSAPEGTKEAEAQRNSERQMKHIDESN